MSALLACQHNKLHHSNPEGVGGGGSCSWGGCGGAWMKLRDWLDGIDILWVRNYRHVKVELLQGWYTQAYIIIFTHTYIGWCDVKMMSYISLTLPASSSDSVVQMFPILGCSLLLSIFNGPPLCSPVLFSSLKCEKRAAPWSLSFYTSFYTYSVSFQ